jgi:hypothetical protein
LVTVGLGKPGLVQNDSTHACKLQEFNRKVCFAYVSLSSLACGYEAWLPALPRLRCVHVFCNCGQRGSLLSVARWCPVSLTHKCVSLDPSLLYFCLKLNRWNYASAAFFLQARCAAMSSPSTTPRPFATFGRILFIHQSINGTMR